MYNKTWNKHRTPLWEQQSTINQQQQNHRATNPFLVICTEKQYSENDNIDAFDNNTRLNKKCHKHVTNAPKGIGLA